MSTPVSVRRRTPAVTVLAVVAAVLGLYNLYDMVRFFGWAEFFGRLSFYQVSWLGGILALILALIWFSVAQQLWTLNPQGLLFIQVISVINLVFLVLAWLGASTWQSVAVGIVVNVVALVLAMLPSTRAAFGQPTQA